MSRYYVTLEFAVEAQSADAAEQLAARRLSHLLGERKIRGPFVAAAKTTTTETHLEQASALLTEETGHVPLVLADFFDKHLATLNTRCRRCDSTDVALSYSVRKPEKGQP